MEELRQFRAFEEETEAEALKAELDKAGISNSITQLIILIKLDLLLRKEAFIAFHILMRSCRAAVKQQNLEGGAIPKLLGPHLIPLLQFNHANATCLDFCRGSRIEVVTICLLDGLLLDDRGLLILARGEEENEGN